MDDFDGDVAWQRGLRRSLQEQQVEWVLEGPSAASGAWDGLGSGKSSVHPSRRVTGFVTAPAAAQILFPLRRRLPFSPPSAQAGFFAAIRRQGQRSRNGHKSRFPDCSFWHVSSSAATGREH